MALRSLGIGFALILVATEAKAAGVDGLRETAREALRRGDPAQAVADLRRARASTLASEREKELRVELTEAERAWFTSLVESAKKLAVEPRIVELLAIRREASRVGSTAGLAAANAALEASLLTVWEARDRGLDDAGTLRLLSRLTETMEGASSLDAIATRTRANVRGKVEAFALPGVDGTYVRDRLSFYYRLRDEVPADPHPAAWSMRPGSWTTGTCGAPLDGIRQVFEKRPGTPIEIGVTTAQCTLSQTVGAGTKVVHWEETVSVPRTERVVKRNTVTERVPTVDRQCTPTYTTTTSQPRPDGPGYVQNYMKTGENCISTSGYREEQVEVESVEYQTHTETQKVQRSARIPTRTRHSKLAYAISARVRVDANEHDFTVEDAVETDEVEYSDPHGRSESFSPVVRDKILDPRFVEKSRVGFEALILRSVRRSRVTDLKATLDAEADEGRRDAILAEIAALEAAGPPELVAHVATRTRLPAAAVTAALLGSRRDTDSPYTDLDGPTRSWNLPKPNAGAARDAFAEEDRSAIKDKGLETSGGVALGMGALARGAGPAFPYVLLAVRVHYIPAALLFRTFTGGGFVEGTVGGGHVIPARLGAGLSMGFHAGPLTLLAEGIGGGDAAFINRDDGDPHSPNEPEIPIAPLVGYGPRATFRIDPISLHASARRSHRFRGSYEHINAIDGALGYGVVQLGGRYETYTDVFSDRNPTRAPWSLAFTIGLAFDVHSADAGELTNRKSSD